MLDPHIQSLCGTVCDVTTGASAPSVPFDDSSLHDEIRRRRQQILDRVENHAYEGATTDKHHGGSGWLVTHRDPNGDLEDDLDITRDRSRSAYRNDSVGGAVDERKDHVVGTGFTYEAQIREESGWITEAQAEEYNDQLEEIMEGLAPRISSSGTSSLWEDCRLVEGHHSFDGESFTIISDEIPDRNKPLPVVIDVIDPMRVETPPERVNDPNCILGVQFDKRGVKVLGYWVRSQHPGNSRKTEVKYEFFERRRVLHVFERFFAGQVRGIAWLARALFRLQDRKDLDQAGIIRAQIEACYVGFIKQTMPQGLNPATGLPYRIGEVGPRGKLEFSYHPGTYRYLGIGEELISSNPPTGLGSADTLSQSNNRQIAAALNWAHEMLSKDWRNVSFAGGRIILSGVKLSTETRQERIGTRWLTPIGEWVVDEAVSLGKVKIPPRLYDERPQIYRRHAWIPQAWPYSLNPGEDVKALLTARDGNLITQATAEARYTGGKWKRTKKVRQRERQDERDLNIVPPANAQAQAALEQPQPGTEEHERQTEKAKQ